MVVERFSQVISQLFQQVYLHALWQAERLLHPTCQLLLYLF